MFAKQKTFGVALILFISNYSYSQDFSTGLEFMDEEEYNRIKKVSAPSMGQLPSSFDLTEWFPKPLQQGQLPSCVGWAVGYGLKSYQEAIETKIKPTSIERTFSPSYIYNQITHPSCSQGSLIYKALDMLKEEGISEFRMFPYDEFNCNSRPTTEAKTNAQNFQINSWNTVDYDDIIEIKSQIHKGFPVVIGMNFDRAFQKLSYNEIYSSNAGLDIGRHAMVVIGYDDNKRAFKLFNSWGNGWGTDGYGWIDYQTFTQKVKEAYVAQDYVGNSERVLTNPANQNTEEIVIIDDDIEYENWEEDETDDDYIYLDRINAPNALPELAKDVSANLFQPRVKHNVRVNTDRGVYNGMIINIPGDIYQGMNSTAQLIIRFYMPDGNPLIANVGELIYRDARGAVATGTPQGNISANHVNLIHHSLAIPYYALNLINTGGRRLYPLNVKAYLFVNNYEVATSPMTPISVYY